MLPETPGYALLVHVPVPVAFPFPAQPETATTRFPGVKLYGVFPDQVCATATVTRAVEKSTKEARRKNTREIALDIGRFPPRESFPIIADIPGLRYELMVKLPIVTIRAGIFLVGGAIPEVKTCCAAIGLCNDDIFQTEPNPRRKGKWPATRS
jgi:hypothetical protein